MIAYGFAAVRASRDAGPAGFGRIGGGRLSGLARRLAGIR
jgi:hypothetical protein